MKRARTLRKGKEVSLEPGGVGAVIVMDGYQGVNVNGLVDVRRARRLMVRCLLRDFLLVLIS